MQIVTSETESTEFNIRDWLLIALTFCTGAVDAISYFGLGKVFSAFMTGNIVYLGFGIGNFGGVDLAPILCALVFFTIGSYLGTRATLPTAGQGPWPMKVTVTLAVVAVIEAVFWACWVASAGAPTALMINVQISLLSLAMGLQMAAVRSLRVQGVFTTAATFTLLALAGDFAGSRPQAEAPRLAGVLIGLVAGAAAGGLLFMHAIAYAPILPLAVTVLVILGGLALARVQPDNGPLLAR
ncbi:MULTISPECIES: YoaK family protein [Rhodomicrobium]|uniref:YoaK family protein n=1 Tax=Rhodomicrobium TaxID=1068 RepID=UPI001482A8C1|nr:MULTISPECIES: YoaK family protein [Rhodomicrobium]